MQTPAPRIRRFRLNRLAAIIFPMFCAGIGHAADSTWIGGTGNWNVAGNWSPSGIPNSALTNVFIDGNPALNSIVTLGTGATVGNLTIDALDTLILANGNLLRIDGGTFSNSGTFQMSSAGFLTDFRVGSNTAATGTGSILMSNNGNNRIYGATGAERLTLGPGFSIIGAGQIGVNLLKVTNQGLIAAEGAAGLTFSVANAAGNFINTGGVIEVRDGSSANFDSGTFEGGTLRGQTTSALRGSVAATLSGMNIEGTLTLRNGEGLGIAGTSTNSGTLKLDSGGFLTDLRVNGDTTLGGTGSILMSNNGNNRIYGATGAERLTLGTGFSIIGAGQIGVNQLKVTNQGLIAAEGAAGLTFSVSNAAGTFVNTGGVIEVRDGSLANFNSGMFEGGTLRGQTTSALRGSVAATLSGMNIEGTLTLRNGEGLGIAGTSTNSGTLKLDSSGFLTDLRVNGDAMLGGSGAIRMSNNGSNRIYGATGAERLTLGAGFSIIGAGQLGLNQLKVTNQGLIAAEGAAGLTFSVANAAGNFINTGGVIEVRDGSLVNFNSGTFEGGTLRGQTTSALRGSVAATLSGMNIEGTLTLRNGEGLGIAGTSTNSGTLKLDSSGFLTDLRVNGDATLGGAGSIVMSNNGFNRIYGATGAERLTLGAGFSIIGAGQLGLNQLMVTNQGLIVADGTAGLRIHVGNAIGSFNNAGGVIEVKDGSFARFDGGLIEGGTLRGNLTSALEGSTAATLSGVSMDGVLGLRNGQGLGIAGLISNNGTLKLESAGFLTDLRVNASTTLGGSGTVALSSNASNRIYGATGNERLTIAAGQTIRGSGQLGVNQLKITNQGSIVADQSVALTVNPTGSDALENAGTIRSETGSQLVVIGSNLQHTGPNAQTIVHGTLTVPQIDLSAGSLSGTGTIIGAVVNTGGTVAPGASPGKLTIQGNYNQGALGTLAVEINGTEQGITHDWLAISGSASLGGTLSLSFGYTPLVGASYVILTTGTGNVTGDLLAVRINNGRLTGNPVERFGIQCRRGAGCRRKRHTKQRADHHRGTALPCRSSCLMSPKYRLSKEFPELPIINKRPGGTRSRSPRRD